MTVLLFEIVPIVHVPLLYFRSVSKALEEIHAKELRMEEELQNDREQENKLKDEIEVCFSYSLSMPNRMDTCKILRIRRIIYGTSKDASHGSEKLLRMYPIITHLNSPV